MCLGFVRGFGSFVAVRAVLGMVEGGLLPGMVLYLSGLYTRGELALRIGIFYTAASLSGAFGGTHAFRWPEPRRVPAPSADDAVFRRSACARLIGHWSSRRPRGLAMDPHHRGAACLSPFPFPLLSTGKTRRGD